MDCIRGILDSADPPREVVASSCRARRWLAALCVSIGLCAALANCGTSRNSHPAGTGGPGNTDAGGNAGAGGGSGAGQDAGLGGTSGAGGAGAVDGSVTIDGAGDVDASVTRDASVTPDATVAPDAVIAPDAPGSTTGLRVKLRIDDGWRFNRADAPGADKAAFDDAAWPLLDLPHTWNAEDGQDGPATPYYRGIGWYRKHYTVPGELAGRTLYLQFDGSNIITDVYVNDELVGTHLGGFATFRFDVTRSVKIGADNVIAVRVNNAAGVDRNNVIVPGSPTINVPPLSGDFTFFGGLYRSVHLLATGPLAISPADFGSSGVYIKQSNVSATAADLAITIKLVNGAIDAKTATVKATLLDAAKGEVLALSGAEAVPANGRTDAVLSGKLTTPHLWNGVADPYLYTVRIDVFEGNRVVDSVTETLGLRTFTLGPNAGFSLNGQYLDLHGVNKHQDQKDKGWAISDADTDADFAILKEIGSTAVRFAHYQHAQHTYDAADREGIIVWAEIGLVNHINNTPEFAANAVQQLTELIRQNYNHPAIVFWGVGNEVLLRPGPNPDALITSLTNVVVQEDSTRLSGYAANAGNDMSPVNWHAAADGFNEYQGWYFGRVADFAIWADTIHAGHPNDAVGVTEYGAGGNIAQHAANPAANDVPGDKTAGAHTEEYQAYYHEGYWTAMKARPFLWGKFVWNGFDFASDGRSEGGTIGLNDKGLVTFDRKTKKDAFYWYKANWSDDPFVYIASKRFTALPKAATVVRVYSNVDSVELKLNGTSLGTKTAPDHLFAWEGITWAVGSNVVEASATSGALTVTDAATFTN
ncbi:MAG TPA: glycoside hydrolase family 2 TIM barrel-domain containing protein [Polyangiaceae bacterium]|nr:glycoside hydrolase family 2 TIM barrel-domain containing protein [Polyangiaceae bacterium]